MMLNYDGMLVTVFVTRFFVLVCDDVYYPHKFGYGSKKIDN